MLTKTSQQELFQSFQTSSPFTHVFAGSSPSKNLKPVSELYFHSKKGKNSVGKSVTKKVNGCGIDTKLLFQG